LTFFNLNLTKGVYVYRPADRELIPFTTFSEGIDAHLSFLSEVNLSDRPFFGGFAINLTHDDTAAQQISILKQLQWKYQNFVTFSAFYGPNAASYETAADLQGLTKPYFFILNASDLSGGRWLIYDDPARFQNVDELSKFVDSIIAGREDFSLISEPIRPDDVSRPLKKLVAANFDKWVLDNPKDVLVGFIGPKGAYCKFLMPVLNETAALLKDVQTLDIAYIDGGLNDLPEYVPEIASYPTVYLWPSGNKTAPVKYGGTRKVDKLIEFLTASVTNAFELPEFELSEIEDRIRATLHPSKNKTK
jgi:thiol-disulfide isomerase/thioredoxin